jgi:hypothetical protein
MQGAFPLVNEYEVKLKEKLHNQKKWQTPQGFDVLNKRENWNLHPKAPTETEKAVLLEPYHLMKKEESERKKVFAYDPAEHGGLDFRSPNKKYPPFSQPDYFKSVFVAGGDAEKEYEDYLKAERDAWEKKVVVANKNFKVNKIVGKHNHLDKYKPILQEDAQKLGLVLSKKKLKSLTSRNIHAE